MSKYVVYAQEKCGFEYIEFETESYSKAYNYCKRKNAKNERYLEECQEFNERPGIVYHYWFVKEANGTSFPTAFEDFKKKGIKKI